MTISVEQLHEMLKYNSGTGKFIWRERAESFPASASAIRRFNSAYAGSQVYEEDHRGYLRMVLLGKRCKSHRVAWAMHHGDWPADQIDHINGVRSDNRIENLRAASQVENSRNTRIPATNMSGVMGVHWDKVNWTWTASIGVKSRPVYLGTFKHFEDAVKARRDAEQQHGYHPNHGRR